VTRLRLLLFEMCRCHLSRSFRGTSEGKQPESLPRIGVGVRGLRKWRIHDVQWPHREYKDELIDDTSRSAVIGSHPADGPSRMILAGTQIAQPRTRVRCRQRECRSLSLLRRFSRSFRAFGFLFLVLIGSSPAPDLQPHASGVRNLALRSRRVDGAAASTMPAVSAAPCRYPPHDLIHACESSQGKPAILPRMGFRARLLFEYRCSCSISWSVARPRPTKARRSADPADSRAPPPTPVPD